MKRALISIQISAHELKGNEMREVIPKSTMDAHGVPIMTTVYFDDEDEFHLLKKVREWLEIARNH